MYYAHFDKTETGLPLVVIRQNRFKALWVEQGINEPFDVVIITDSILRAKEMTDKFLVGEVDWSLTTT